MSEEAKDPGLGSSYNKKVKRVLNADGSYNVKRKGGLNNFNDIYKFLIEIKPIHLLSILIGVYLLLNIIFACLYYFIGDFKITGIENSSSPFLDCIYFSFQTFTTVGYGTFSPSSHTIHIIASFEAFTGFLSFSIATGIIYGRFSKPKTKIDFSNNILFTPHKEGDALMFKMVNKRNNVLLNCEVNAMLIMDKNPEKLDFNKEYYNLELDTNKVQFFPLTWTLVHSISDSSPIYNLTYNDFIAKNPEVILLVKAFDETFSQDVFQKHSYSEEQWLHNVKFTKNFMVNEEGEIILHLNEINDVENL